jgi:hypothetical protein
MNSMNIHPCIKQGDPAGVGHFSRCVSYGGFGACLRMVAKKIVISDSVIIETYMRFQSEM